MRAISELLIGADCLFVLFVTVAPTLKHLFKGFDVTLFAYGVTGTGKTHTMRGGKSLADRGVIPRLLSGIYRRSRKVEKDSAGATVVQVSMSYYEIYNDRVYDLFEPLEKRTAAGLPLREQHGKTIVVGLTERPCTSLKEFERLYDQANVNRSTSATKLNAHSSRSHAILCVKISMTTGDETRVSTASAIDLAGSEDNRRTDNGRERLVESASINKSLFVLAQCVEAISRKQSRIPYRESKMTRILSLGQNNGLTIMILNLAPVKSYHLDSLSSLNFANRTKKIEAKEIENEPIFKGHPTRHIVATTTGINRQPLRPISNIGVGDAIKSLDGGGASGGGKDVKKPSKAFSVYSDRNTNSTNRQSAGKTTGTNIDRTSGGSRKRKVDSPPPILSRPAKTARQNDTEEPIPEARRRIGGGGGGGGVVSKADLEEIVERKVEEILAAKALNEAGGKEPVVDISEQMQQRLDALEEKIEKKQDAKAEGLTYLLMAKQHHVRGEDGSALKMYQLALPHFPANQKLISKMAKLEEKIRTKRQQQTVQLKKEAACQPRRQVTEAAEEPSVSQASNNKGSCTPPRTSIQPASTNPPPPPPPPPPTTTTQTPRTRHLLETINSRCVKQIKTLKGVGSKKAEMILEALRRLDHECPTTTTTTTSAAAATEREKEKDRKAAAEDDEDDAAKKKKVSTITNLDEFARLKGVGARMVEVMRSGLAGV
ncbi:MAG: hypothetical protein M1816_007057 [Peltula sp. TS41687]|nr:MAG: hypothetical protein M1816_007057 [Peltula sp. TS41687]